MSASVFFIVIGLTLLAKGLLSLWKPHWTYFGKTGTPPSKKRSVAEAIFGGLIFLLAAIVATEDPKDRLQPHYSADLEPEAKGLIQSNFDALLRTCPGLLTYSDDLAFERATDNFHFAELNNAQASAENQVPLQANLVYKVNDNPSSLLRKWGASSHSCFYSFARDGKTLSIVKKPCQSICLGRESQNEGTLRLNLKMTDAELARQAAMTKAYLDRYALIKNQFHFNGSNFHVERKIKEHMNDPDSYEHEATFYTEEGDFLLVKTAFRGKNVYGGMVKTTAAARVDLNGNVVEFAVLE